MPVAQHSKTLAARSIDRLRIDLPSELVEQYEALAILAGLALEDYISQHLTRTQHWTDRAPIYLDDAQSAKIRKLLGARVGSTVSVVDAVRKAVGFGVGGFNIDLPMPVLEQLYWAAKSAGRPIELVAPELILAAIREKFQA